MAKTHLFFDAHGLPMRAEIAAEKTSDFLG